MIAVHSAGEIAAAIAGVQARASGIDFIRQLQDLRFEPGWSYPGDPLSEEYHAAVLGHYAEVSGRPYASPSSNESFAVPRELHLPAPFPHCTGDAGEVSRYLLGVGHIIGAVEQRAPARIAEFGAGWGHVSFHLAQMGHQVTAVDVNPGSVELLRERAQRNEVRLDVRQAGYLDVEFEPGSLDVAIFFESFHHCHRPFDLLDRLERWLAPSGLLVFAAEPFYRGFHAPWDVRIDGQSLWAAHANGWLELGFEESFLVETLMRRGWALRRRALDAAGPYGIMFLATRQEGRFVPGESYLPPDVAARWAPHDDAHPYPHRWTSGASVLPLDGAPRWRRLTVGLSSFRPGAPVTVDLRCGPFHATRILGPGETAEVCLPLPEGSRRDLQIASPTWRPCDEGVNEDARTLGVAVGALRYESAP